MISFKSIVIALVFILGATQTNETITLASEVSQITEEMIPQEEANKIALNEVPGMITNTDIIEEDENTYYVILVEGEFGIWEIYVDAFTAEVVGIVNMDESYDNIMPAKTREITREEAEKIALEHVQGRIIYVDQEFEDGFRIFSVYVLNGLMMREVDIDIQTGQILEIETNLIPLATVSGLLIFIIGFIIYRKKFKKNPTNV